jgi:hypothetical protein
MRKALNENPLVQAGLIGVLALVFGLMLLMRSGGGAAESPPSEAPATAADPAAAAATTADPAATTTDPAAGAIAPAETASPPGSAAPAVPAEAAGFAAGPGLPADVVSAYDAGKAIVLLIVRHRGIDDRRVEQMVSALGSRSDAAVFTTRAAGIARYSRIAQGVDVDHTPALVVIRPKNLTEGPVPTASVSYGFRDAPSVEQALDDALYKGREDLPYYP